jgi:NAD(P)-dependent dehydrogenase (short-subunit alcohol dehydrogenase family)
MGFHHQAAYEIITMSAPMIQTPITDRLSGQVALITGAGGNIGLATASRFLQEGAKVALVDISPIGLEQAFSTLKKLDLPEDVTAESHTLCIQADVTSAEDVQKYVDEIVKAWGRLDTAFLCAGISYNSTSIFDTSEETWDKIMKVNTRSGMALFLTLRCQINSVRSAFLGIKYVATTMRDLKTGGSIILASSIAGLRATPGLSAYSSAKYALRGLCQTTAAELGQYGIRVNTIHPCGVNTPMFLETWSPEKMADLLSRVPLGRWANVEDVAAVVAFLASKDAVFLTGVALKIDGGAVTF